ncbi:hypothetical protein STEG23_027762, partial [Scotinomys teguina]
CKELLTGIYASHLTNKKTVKLKPILALGVTLKLGITEDELKKLLSIAGRRLVVVEFSAAWCGPCKMIRPIFQAMSLKYENVMFANVDVDLSEELAQLCCIKAVPTFQMFKNTQKEAFQEALASAGDKLVVVDFSATWCGPCKMIKPFFHSLSEKYSSVVFLEVDVDDCQDVAAECEVKCMPTFQFYKKGQKEFSIHKCTCSMDFKKHVLYGNKCGSSSRADVPQHKQTYHQLIFDNSPQCLLFSRMRMKGLACPCPALPNFLELGACLMAEGSQTQASSGQGPPVNIQFLRAQYEGLRRRQRTQAHLMVFPKEGTILTPAESMTSAVWINKERKSSLSPDDTDSEVEGTLEEVDRSCHQAPETPWRTYLEMHRLVQTLYLEASHQGNHKGSIAESEARLSPEGDPNVLENSQKTQQETKIPGPAQCQGQEGRIPLQAAGSSFQASVQHLPSTKNLYKSGKTVHYPFPQRKHPRISQAARNLGLYGPS